MHPSDKVTFENVKAVVFFQPPTIEKRTKTRLVAQACCDAIMAHLRSRGTVEDAKRTATAKGIFASVIETTTPNCADRKQAFYCLSEVEDPNPEHSEDELQYFILNLRAARMWANSAICLDEQN